MCHLRFKLNICRLMALLLVLFFLLPSNLVAKAAEVSGSCGDGVNWSLSGSTLTISGSGQMANYQEFTPAPWSTYADQIRSVRVESGVTSVGDFAFFSLEQISTVSLSDTVVSIGNYSFYGNTSLELLTLGNGLQTIGTSAFEECTSLMSVKLPNSLKSIQFHAFYRCESLTGIIVPPSVTFMGTTVFGYCTELRSAQILANIEELPLWTFYGCYKLSKVSMAANIVSVGVYAFHGCEQLPEDTYTNNNAAVNDQSHNDSSSSVKPNGDTVITNSQVTSSENSSIKVDTIVTQNDETTKVDVKVDAVLEDKSGWADAEEQVKSALRDSDSVRDNAVEVTVNLKSETTVSGDDLARFAGRDVKLTVRTQQGTLWHINGKDLDKRSLSENYDLSFTIREITDPTEAQKNVVGIGTSYVVIFHSDIDFKTEVELPLTNDLRLATAIFFAPVEEEYQRMQAVVIDEEGVAHFYLANVQAETEYLVGINIPNRENESTVSDAIVPENLQNSAQPYEQVEEIQYIVTGIKSSWGMNLGQVMWILAGVMGGTMVIVGVVVYIMFKRKLKQGYVPDMSYADERGI